MFTFSFRQLPHGSAHRRDGDLNRVRLPVHRYLFCLDRCIRYLSAAAKLRHVGIKDFFIGPGFWHADAELLIGLHAKVERAEGKAPAAVRGADVADDILLGVIRIQPGEAAPVMVTAGQGFFFFIEMI